MARRDEEDTSADSPDTPVSSRDADHKHLVTEHRVMIVGGDDHNAAVETFHVFDGPDGPYEEYDHEASNVTGPTQSITVRTEPTLRDQPE